jgi:hypothetical protein
MNREQRAAQLWSVLAVAATNRQIMTYELVGRITGLPPASIGDFLRPIQQYCIEKKLPPLTVLVVGKQDATPGVGFLGADDVPSAQLRVFEYGWTGMQAPGESDLADAYTRAPDRR